MSDRLISSEWEVRSVDIATARNLVERLHYAAGASNTATYLFGLFPIGSVFLADCVGVTWWIPPTKSAGAATYPENPQGVLALSRLVIGDAPSNAASFLLSRSRKKIDRIRWPMLVTYADTWRGHTGAIYKADNWTYIGLTKPERIYTIDGRMVARKAGPKTRTHAEMLSLGATCEGSFPRHKFSRIKP